MTIKESRNIKQDTKFLESPFKFRLLWGRAAARVSKLAQDQRGSHPGAILQVELEPTGETRFLQDPVFLWVYQNN